MDSSTLTANPNTIMIVDGSGNINQSALVPAANLPSYVDDVLEYANVADFPATGTSGKIYFSTVTGLTYRWTGSIYAVIRDDSVIDTSSGTHATANIVQVDTLRNKDNEQVLDLTYDSPGRDWFLAKKALSLEGNNGIVGCGAVFCSHVGSSSYSGTGNSGVENGTLMIEMDHANDRPKLLKNLDMNSNDLVNINNESITGILTYKTRALPVLETWNPFTTSTTTGTDVDFTPSDANTTVWSVTVYVDFVATSAFELQNNGTTEFIRVQGSAITSNGQNVTLRGIITRS